MDDRREPAHPEDAARWAALTGPIAPEAMDWAEKHFAADDEVQRAS
jgi:hypothetical protein